MQKVLKSLNYIYALGANGTFRISPNCINIISSFEQHDKNQTEAGGVLLGKQFSDNNEIIVDEVTTPFPSDKRGRKKFYRSKAHNEYAQASWTDSGHTSLFWGLWHTHPEPDPKPSRTDFIDWRKAIAKCHYEGESLFFIIVGTEKINCWIGKKKKKRVLFPKYQCEFEKLELKNV